MTDYQQSRCRFRITSIIIATAMLMGAFGAFIGPFTVNVSAVADTHTWNGDGLTELASDDDNWVSDAAPEAEDSVIIDAGDKNCTWDLAVVFVDFSIGPDYAGVVTLDGELALSGQLANNGTIYQDGYVISIEGADPWPYIGFGAFDGDMYLNGSAAVLKAEVGASMGYVHSYHTVQLWVDGENYLQFAPGPEEQIVGVTDLTFGESVTWTALSNDDAIFTAYGVEAGRMYRVYVDGDSYALVTADSLGSVSFTYTGDWSAHDFELSPTFVGPQVSSMVNVLFIMMALGLVLGIIGIAVNSIRNHDMTAAKVLNMVLCVVIGLAMLGVLYTVIN